VLGRVHGEPLGETIEEGIPLETTSAMEEHDRITMTGGMHARRDPPVPHTE
jgi:hypothetical protein